MRLDIIARVGLFSGIAPTDIDRFLDCCDARVRTYAQGERAVWEGEPSGEIGIVLTGCFRAVREDAFGHTLLMALLDEGAVFGDVLAGSRARPSPVSVAAQEPSSALRIPGERLLGCCAEACAAHGAILRNYVGIVSEKHLALQERIAFLTQPTVRQKIESYLSGASRGAGDRAFEIPFDRASMAQYLNVERSALSRELSRMKRAGAIDYRKNAFRLLGPIGDPAPRGDP